MPSSCTRYHEEDNIQHERQQAPTLHEASSFQLQRYEASSFQHSRQCHEDIESEQAGQEEAFRQDNCEDVCFGGSHSEAGATLLEGSVQKMGVPPADMFHFAHLRAGRNEDLPDGHGIDMTAENAADHAEFQKTIHFV